MNVIIAINGEYIEVCKTMIFSLLRHNACHNVTIHIINKNLSKSQIISLEQFIHLYGGEYAVYDFSNEIFDDLTLGDTRFSVEMYFRILSYKILPDSIDRAMWLDSDLIVRGDLGSFYYQDFDDNAIIACQDANNGTEFIRSIKKNMDLSDNHCYFNSGVLVFNFEYIRKYMSDEIILNIINEYRKKLTYPDQDLLNRLYTGKVKYNEWEEYNFQVNEIYKCNIDGILILHYAGNRKPWLAKRAYPISKSYWKERLLLGDYVGAARFYIIYWLLFIPKMIKRIMGELL